MARPSSQIYRFQKLVRRNKLVFSAASTVVLALLIGLFTTQRQAKRAQQAERAQRQLRQAAEEARAGEASQRETAEQRLYDSLMREARATRIARGVGYRAQVFALLEQARSLIVPQRDLAELRREATTCLGDFVGLPTTTFAGFPEGATILKARLDPTGQTAVFVLSDGSIGLREAASGKDVGRLKTEEPVWDFCFDSKGERFVSVHLASIDFPHPNTFVDWLPGATVRLWVRETDGQWVKSSKTPTPGAFKGMSTADRLYVAVRNAEAGTLDLLDAEDNKLLHRIPFSNRLWSFSPTPVLSPNGQWLAIPLGQSEVQIWDLNNGQQIALLDPEHPFFSVEFSPSGKYLAADGSVYSTDGFKHVVTLGYQGALHLRLSFGTGEKLALPLLEQTRVWIRDVPRNADWAFLDMPFSPRQLAFASDGSSLLASSPYEARLFPMRATTEKLEAPGHVGAANAACFSPDGSHLATVGSDLKLQVCDARTGRLVWEAESLPGQGGRALRYSPDGRYVATGYRFSEKLSFWDVQTGARLAELEIGPRATHAGFMSSLQFTPDGRNFITAQHLNKVITEPEGIAVWSLDAASPGIPVAQITRRMDGRIWSLALAPDGRQAAFLDIAGPFKLCLWDFTATNAPRVVATDVMQSVQLADFTPDSEQLIYLSGQREVVTLDVASGQVLSSFPTRDLSLGGTAAPEPNLCLSPDGAKLALSSVNRRGVDILDPKTGELLYPLPEQNGTVLWLAWSPDSRRLAVARSDGEVAIWNLSEIEEVLGKLGLVDSR